MEMKIMQSRNQQNETLVYNQKKYQQGNIMLVLLAVVTLVGLIAYTWNAGSKDANTSTDKKAAQLAATSILEQASALSNAFAQYANDGRDTSTTTVTNGFGTNAKNKLFFGSYNYGVPQTSTARAFSNNVSGTWLLNTATPVPGPIGSAAPDYILALEGLSLNTCRAINNILFNTDVATATPTGSLTAATGIDLTTGLGTNDSASADMSITGTETYDTGVTSSGKDRGCLKNAVGTYTYYQVVYVQ
jgi:hypothetical protein